jgi:hypothetical protein
MDLQVLVEAGCIFDRGLAPPDACSMLPPDPANPRTPPDVPWQPYALSPRNPSDDDGFRMSESHAVVHRVPAPG